jgi:hypothetical protein
MSKKPDFPPELSLDDVLVRVAKSDRNPNIGPAYTAKLYEGDRVSKVATLKEILVGATGEHHHWSLNIASYKRLKIGWFVQKERSVTIEDNQGGSLQKLLDFLQSSMGGALPDESGEYRVLSAEAAQGVENLLELANEASDQSKVDLLEVILRSDAIGRVGTEQLVAVLESTPTEVIQNLATATRLIEYQRALDEFKQLVSDCCDNETTIQKHLEANPWLFGSEYSVLLDRRKWTRDHSLDFMLRRTTDGYLEIIEIKTPFSDPILRYDKSHDSYYPSSKLSIVQGQVGRYISEVKRKRDSIRAEDKEDPLEIRARVVIGRDGNEAHQHALRSHNAQLHSIEVLTFDQLVRIGERTLEVFREEAKSGATEAPRPVAQVAIPDDDLPF